MPGYSISPDRHPSHLSLHFLDFMKGDYRWIEKIEEDPSSVSLPEGVSVRDMETEVLPAYAFVVDSQGPCLHKSVPYEEGFETERVFLRSWGHTVLQVLQILQRN